MSENKVDNAINKTANKIDGAIDEVVESKYLGWLFRFVFAAGVSFGIGWVVGGIVYLLSEPSLGNPNAEYITIVSGLIVGIWTFIKLKKRKN